MKLSEFIEQNEYCKQNNTPNGRGCDNCPAIDKDHCADALFNLCHKWLTSIGKPESKEISEELDRQYGMTPLAQLGLVEGFIEFKE